MKHPHYHLRPNKAVERLTFIEAIRHLAKAEELSDYTYYGLGGPYLDDFRLIYEFYPEMKMVSIEDDKETLKRQQFHLPCGAITLKSGTLASFIAAYESGNEKAIFWLDYTGLEYAHFDEFMALLGKVAANSMLKITLRANPRDYFDSAGSTAKAEEFRQKFELVLPGAFTSPPVRFDEYTVLIQDMLRIAAQKALPSALPLTFQPVSSFYYADGAGILTVTGVVCPRSERAAVKARFQKWPFRNLNWKKPKRIDVPVLSTKERLHLQHLLPCGKRAGRVLRGKLAYLIDDSKSRTETKLQQYADFHRYFPYFMKAVP